MLSFEHGAPPLRPDHVARPALVAQLRRGLSGRLTLLVAPAGFGKTTALAELFATLADEPEPPRIAFLSLEAVDADAERLAHGLRRVLVARPTIVALDDFHLVDGEATILRDLATWVDTPGDRPRLVIASRRRPDWPLARWRGRGELAEVDALALRFAEDETRAFFRARLGRELDAEVADRLHRRAEGWPAALQLALAAGADTSLVDALTADHRPVADYLAEYLTEEVLDHLDTERRHLLETLSILDAFSPRLAAAVVEEGDVEEALRQLERLHLPIVRLDAEGAWWRFHPLFAELLRRRLDRDRAARAHRRASRWFDAEGDAERALEHAHRAVDSVWAETLLIRHGRALVDSGEGLVVERAVDRLDRPLETLDARIVSSYGWAALLLHRPERLRRAIAVLEARAAADRLDAESGARFHALLGVAARARGDLDAARRDFTEALDVAPVDDPPLRSTLALQLGITLTFALELDRAAEVYEHCLALDPDPQAMTWLGAMSCLAQVRASQGRLGQAEMLCRQALDRDGVVDPRPAEALVLRTLGRIELERGAWQSAAEHLDEALDRSRRQGFDELVALTALWQAELARAVGDRGAFDDALATVDRLPTRDRLPPLQRRWAKALAIHRALDDGDRADAEARGRALTRPADPPTMADVPVRLALARLGAERGDIERATDEIDMLVDLARHRGAREVELEARVWRAWIESRRGASERVRSSLGRALALAVDEGHVRPFTVAPPADVVPVLETAVAGASPRGAAHGKRALDAVRSRQDRLAVRTRGDATLTDREHEVLRLVADGLPNRRIAESLGVAPSTVKTHLRHLFDKLDARRRTQAVARGRALGLLG
ncbi:MAG: LuxR C-terminal-related transcriptional regulator [Acidobacteriota bacterium]